MKLDFLKKGLVNTANFIPNFAYGNVNKDPISIGINVLGRLLSLYLYFQFNSSLDIKSIIIAILFPTLYIVYIIAVNGIDNVLDVFGLETGSFTDIFSDSDEQCVEKRGPDGDDPSNPDNKRKCNSVIMGRADSRINCESVEDDNSLKICKYIGGEDTRYRSCSSITNQTSCNSSDLSCRWNSYNPSDYATTKQICDGAESRNGGRYGVSIDDCPTYCPYYFNEKGILQFGINDIFVNLNGTPNNPTNTDGNGGDTSNDVMLTFGTTPTLENETPDDFGENNEIILQVSPSSVNPKGFTPHTSNAYKDSDVDIIYINGNVPRKILKGKIKSISNEMLTAGEAYVPTDDDTQLSISSDYYIILKNIDMFQTLEETDVDWTDLTKVKVQVKLPTTSNTCGVLYKSSGGDLIDFNTTEVSGNWNPSNMYKVDTLRNTGVCNSTS